MRLAVAAILLASSAFAGIVDDVLAALNRHDFAGADVLVQAYRRARGADPQLAEAISWEGRAALAFKNLDRAAAYADQTRQMVLPNLRGPRADREQWLFALGASIEVQAQVMAVRGETAQAVLFLRGELKNYGGTSLRERIQKNINTLTMEGKPAPELEAGPSMASLRGKAILLLFWAHWCGDCRAEIPMIAGMMRKFGPRGLVLIGPTKYYGYVAGGQDAPPEVEKPYIEKIRRQFYAPLGNMPVPLSNANFERYGASTTPTLVLVDRQGIVRWYHPGTVREPELTSQIERVLR